MSKFLNRENRAGVKFAEGEEAWSAGDPRRAFRLFLRAAKGGYVPAFDLVAHFYDSGTGVKANREAALHWYELSYRSSEKWYRRALSTAATNIGCIRRDRGETLLAIKWFKRAIALGDGDANLNIARIYLRHEGAKAKALPYLRRTIAAPYVTDGAIEEAQRLLGEFDAPAQHKNRQSRRRTG